MYIHVHVFMCRCVPCVCGTCGCVHVLVYYVCINYPSFLCMRVWFSATSARSEPSHRRIQIRVHCGRDTLTIRRSDTRGDSEIRTSSYNADSMAIRTQNRVISCECLLLHYYYLSLLVNILSVFIRLHFCLIITMFRYCLYMLIIVHGYIYFDDIYTTIVVFWDWNVLDKLSTWYFELVIQ